MRSRIVRIPVSLPQYQDADQDVAYSAIVSTKLRVLHIGNMMHWRREQARLCLSAINSSLQSSQTPNLHNDSSDSQIPQGTFPSAARVFPGAYKQQLDPFKAAKSQ